MKISNNGRSSCCLLLTIIIARTTTTTTTTRAPAATATAARRRRGITSAAFVNSFTSLDKSVRYHRYQYQESSLLLKYYSSSFVGKKDFKSLVFGISTGRRSSSSTTSSTTSSGTLFTTAMTSTMNKQQQQQQQEQQQRYPYPLIDVDCNLLHPDLMNRTLLVPTMVANTNAADGGIQEDNENPFWILDHPSTALSNIQGIFSPSSTVEEAEKMYDFLCQWEQQQQKEEEEEEDKQEVNHNHTAINVRMSVGVHPYHTMGGSSVSSLFENNNIRIRQLLQKDQQRYQQQQQQQQQQQNGQGNWIGPTIIHHHSKDDAAIKEEIFGPVLSVYKASSWKEAIEIENSNPFGNAACIYTSNGACADWFTERFRAAMLGVNVGIPVPREPFSFGGLYGTLSKYGDMDITGDGAIEFFSNRIKVTTKWILPKEASAGMNNGDVVDKANFAGNM